MQKHQKKKTTKQNIALFLFSFLLRERFYSTVSSKKIKIRCMKKNSFLYFYIKHKR